MPAGPQTIYIIRHGEKQPTPGEVIPKPQRSSPEYAPPTNGVDVAGSQTPGTTPKDRNGFDPITDSLIPRGWQRAGALAALFAKMPAAGGPFQQPDHLMAAAYPAWPTKGPKDTDPPTPPADPKLTHRHRPYQTVHPLAERLRLPIDHRYQVGNEQAAIENVMTLRGVVLICWEHDHIFIPGSTPAGLVAHIPAGTGGAWPTTKWSGDHFDLVWHFERDPATGTYSWQEECQDLLLGDQTP